MIDYVIIQAGGKGTRMGKYTFNKPKALVPINGKPFILNTMEKLGDRFYIIIGDYKYDVLKRYLRKFATRKYVLLKAKGKGTCSGIGDSLKYIPDQKSFVIIWSDLYIEKPLDLEKYFEKRFNGSCGIVGLTNKFPCRWSFENGELKEKPSNTNGVMGIFAFESKRCLSDIPESGEFVRYLHDSNKILNHIYINEIEEFGTLSKYENHLKKYAFYRPFNKIVIKKDRVIKEPIDSYGSKLSNYERKWYKQVEALGFVNAPKVFSYKPFTLERINGRHPFDISASEKIVIGIIESLKKLHDTAEHPVNYFDVYREYYQKTFERLYKVKDIIPFSDKEYIYINGVKSVNPFYIEDIILEKIKDMVIEKFTPIHGDPTFSNTLITNDGIPFFIDPRGYFGYTSFFGDPDYDFAKVYYSIKGNYDQFNRKNFTLEIKQEEVKINIASNGYDNFEELFFELIGRNKKEKIQFLHAIIWLSLTTYAWDDFDMICGAFYNGTLLLSEILKL